MLTSSIIELVKRAGTPFSYEVSGVNLPHAILWKDDVELYSAACLFTATATPGGRTMEMRIKDPGGLFMGGWSSQIGPTPGEIRRIAWSVDNVQDTLSNLFFALRSMPRVIIPSGYSLEIRDIFTRDVNDTLSMLMSGYILELGALTP